YAVQEGMVLCPDNGVPPHVGYLLAHVRKFSDSTWNNPEACCSVLFAGFKDDLHTKTYAQEGYTSRNHLGYGEVDLELAYRLHGLACSAHSWEDDALSPQDV